MRWTTLVPIPYVPCDRLGGPTERPFSAMSRVRGCRGLPERACGIVPHFCGSTLLLAWLRLGRVNSKSECPAYAVGFQPLDLELEMKGGTHFSCRTSSFGNRAVPRSR